MRELEAKFRVDCSLLADVRRRVESLGFKLVDVVEELDYYYSHPCRDFAVTDEAVRVRISKGLVELTYKGPRGGGEFKSREEYSVAIGSESIKRILELLGFKQVMEVVKRRSYYEGRGILVSIDEVRGLGCYVEIEVKDGEEEVIKSVAESLGFTPGDYEPRTYLELLLEKRASP